MRSGEGGRGLPLLRHTILPCFIGSSCVGFSKSLLSHAKKALYSTTWFMVPSHLYHRKLQNKHLSFYEGTL